MDFDGVNTLWSIYGKEAQTHDEVLFQSLSADMDGVPTFVRVVRRLEFTVMLLTCVSAGRLVGVRSRFLPYQQSSKFAT